MGMAPDGHHIRMMEPGEAERLLLLGTKAGLFGAVPPDIGDVVRWLVRHEVFVAETAAGRDGARLSGFAAGRDATDLYWIAGLAVDPAFRGIGLRKALLAAVVARAGWFFHRAVGLAAAKGEEADWLRRRRFLAVSADEGPEHLQRLRRERPGFDSLASDPAGTADLVGSERIVMIHWL